MDLAGYLNSSSAPENILNGNVVNVSVARSWLDEIAATTGSDLFTAGDVSMHLGIAFDAGSGLGFEITQGIGFRSYENFLGLSSVQEFHTRTAALSVQPTGADVSFELGVVFGQPEDLAGPTLGLEFSVTLSGVSVGAGATIPYSGAGAAGHALLDLYGLSFNSVADLIEHLNDELPSGSTLFFKKPTFGQIFINGKSKGIPLDGSFEIGAITGVGSNLDLAQASLQSEVDAFLQSLSDALDMSVEELQDRLKFSVQDDGKIVVAADPNFETNNLIFNFLVNESGARTLSSINVGDGTSPTYSITHADGSRTYHYTEAVILSDGTRAYTVQSDTHLYDGDRESTTGAGGRSTNGANGWSTHDDRPIIVDLDGDGIEIAAQSIVAFDRDEDGFLEQGSWAAPDDGFLVLDLNADGTRGAGDGKIDQTRELVLALWGAAGMTDLQALAQAHDADGNLLFDTWVDANGNGVRDQDLNGNYVEFGDGVLDANDAVWHELRVWQDVNQDGITDRGELFVLSGVSATAWYDDNKDGVQQASEIFVLQEASATVWNDLNADGVTQADELTQGVITDINLTYDDGSDFAFTDDDIRVFGNTLHGLASLGTRNGTVVGGVGDVSLDAGKLGWREVPTALGFAIEFENGETLSYAVIESTDPKDVDLETDWLDGATGDGRDNVLDATDHVRAVQITGGGGDDTLIGGMADDMLSGDDGIDHLLGRGGNDLIFFDYKDVNGSTGDNVKGGSGYDTAIYVGTEAFSFDLKANGFETAYAGEGNDTLEAGYSGYTVALYGGAGNDELNASYTDDIVSGDDGNDILRGRAGDDLVVGGAGADHLQGDVGDDVLLGGNGDDDLSGGAGDDILNGGAGNDVFWGDIGDDRLGGDAGADTLRGADGDDFISGGDGNDLLEGGDGDDKLEGDAGNDVLHGGAGDDFARGGDGNDTFHDSDGDDIYFGDDGDDTFSITEFGGQNRVHGGAGVDTLILSGTADQWSWEFVYESPSAGLGQYLFWSGDTYLHVQDVEQVHFTGNRNEAYWSHIDEQDSEEFGLSYIASHGDLINAFGDNWMAGRNHWFRNGIGEDREFRFNPLLYLAAHEDVYNMHGLNLAASAEHYIIYGRDAGRSRGDFDAEQYLRNYSDIRAAYGSDLSAATRHYIKWGRDAGRTDTALPNAMTDTQWQTWLAGAAGAAFNTTLAHTDPAADNSDTFYYANHLAETDPNATIYTWNARENDISGGSGNDTIVSDASGHWYHPNADIVLGEHSGNYPTGGNDSVAGGDGADLILGGLGTDLLAGQSGTDFVRGEEGNDTLFGGSGEDHLRGDAGNDALHGREGRDLIFGGLGADLIEGNEGADALFGGSENDTIFGNTGADLLEGGEGDDSLSGGDGSDTLDGGAGNDSLKGDGGADLLWGGNGHDLLDGGLGDDRLDGENGNDTILAGAGNDYLLGGAGNDSMEGHIGQDALEGGDGNDTLAGNQDNDILNGGNGHDALYGGEENDVLNGGEGADTLDGGTGLDAVSYANATIAIAVRIDNVDPENFRGEAIGDVFVGIENVFGSSLNDSLFGSNGHNALWGADGDDRLYGLNGNDDLYGGAGDDLLYGHSGVDRLIGGDGDDNLLGGAGADQLVGGAGLDRATYVHATSGVLVDFQYLTLNTGEALGDTYDGIEDLYGSIHIDDLRGDGQNNRLWGDIGDDKLRGRQGDDTLWGGDGDDIIWGGGGADRIDGGAGIDRAQYSSASSGVLVDLENNALNTGEAAGDVLTSIENLYGSSHGDDLRGDALNNSLRGAGGNDTLDGRKGSDFLYGEDGNDLLIGGENSDSLEGGAGNDTIFSASQTVNAFGADTVRGGDGDDVLNGSNGANLLYGDAGHDTITGGSDLATAEADSIYGGAGNDRIESGQVLTPTAETQANGDRMFGEAGNDTIIGGLADDLIVGGENSDSLEGGGGNDTIYVSSASLNSFGNDTAHGGTGNDSIIGSNGTNTLFGNAGNDTITGGNDLDTPEIDHLFGGDGHDSLISGQIVDPRDGFEHGGDKLYGEAGNDTLTGGKANDALSGGSGADVFIFLSGFGDDTISDFNVSQAGEVIDLRAIASITGFGDLMASHATQSGGHTIIDDGAGNSITLTGVALSSLSAGDFLFA